MVDLDPLDDPQEIAEVRGLIEEHLQYTESKTAERVLARWDSVLSDFVKVMPVDYKRVLRERAEFGHAATFVEGDVGRRDSLPPDALERDVAE
jgi:glutamate synthase domain-containing protein 3